MQIGITTFWQTSDNYGQQLQMWALQQHLREEGHQPFLIRYAPAPLSSPLKDLARTLLIASRWWIFIKSKTAQRWAEAAIERRLGAINRSRNVNRDFAGFRQQHIAMSEKIYRSLEELQETPPTAEAYITGSDQVWFNSLINPQNKIWYLHFGIPQTLRIAYAASIGRNIEPQELPIFTEMLRSFNAVSVREENAVRQCQEAGRSDAVQVIDPTLLLLRENYEDLIRSHTWKTENPYIFSYVLNIKTAEDFYVDQIERYRLSVRLEHKTVSSSGYYQARDFFSNTPPLLPTIPEWIRLIRDAACVVTSSFHGLVFAIIFHRPFVAIPLTGKHSKANARITSLLESLGIEGRMMKPSADFQTLMQQPIQWEKVEKKMNRLRDSSLQFLREALQFQK